MTDTMTPEAKKIFRAQVRERIKEARRVCGSHKARAKKATAQYQRFSVDLRDLSIALELARSLTARVELLNGRLRADIAALETALARSQAERKLWGERNAG